MQLLAPRGLFFIQFFGILFSCILLVRAVAYFFYALVWQKLDNMVLMRVVFLYDVKYSNFVILAGG
jgi:hypothetical protein